MLRRWRPAIWSGARLVWAWQRCLRPNSRLSERRYDRMHLNLCRVIRQYEDRGARRELDRLPRHAADELFGRGVEPPQIAELSQGAETDGI